MTRTRLPFPPAPSVPSTWIQSLDLYTNEGIAPGSFVRSVLENDLVRAIKTAAPADRAHVPALVDYCLEHLPMRAWGNAENVRCWLNRE